MGNEDRCINAMKMHAYSSIASVNYRIVPTGSGIIHSKVKLTNSTSNSRWSVFLTGVLLLHAQSVISLCMASVVNTWLLIAIAFH